MKIFLLLLMLIPILAHAEESEKPSADIKSIYDRLHSSRFSLLPHRETFLLPFVYNTRPHEGLYDELKSADPDGRGDYYRKSEAEFQISFAVPVIRKLNKQQWDVLVAYTHHSWWQVYNSGWSKPFRETNYMPEVFSRFVFGKNKRIGPVELFAVDVGYVHESNGQARLLSRSWDRIFFRGMFQARGLNLILSGWSRLSDSSKTDDNPDIYDYRGLGEIELFQKIGKHTLGLKSPLFAHHDSYDFRYYYPLRTGLKWFVSYRVGYGHSLIEYDKRTERIGVGVTLENFFNN